MIYLVVAAFLVPVFGSTHSLTWLLVLGPFVGFFGTGFFSGFSAIASELFPTEDPGHGHGPHLQHRARLLRAGARSRWVGRTRVLVLRRVPPPRRRLPAAALLALALPETKGKQLD